MVDKNGYCIDYRETLVYHYARIAIFLDTEPKPISMWDFGSLDDAKNLYGKGKCG